MENLGLLRRASGVSQIRLARLSGVSRSRLQRAESGDLELHSDEMNAIRGVLLPGIEEARRQAVALVGNDAAVATGFRSEIHRILSDVVREQGIVLEACVLAKYEAAVTDVVVDFYGLPPHWATPVRDVGDNLQR